jgi:hypothetical protein
MCKGEFILKVNNRKKQTDKFPQCHNQCDSERCALSCEYINWVDTYTSVKLLRKVYFQNIISVSEDGWHQWITVYNPPSYKFSFKQKINIFVCHMLHFGSCSYSLTLKIKRIDLSKTSLHFHYTIWHYIPEDGTFHGYCCKNIKSSLILLPYICCYCTMVT